MAEVAGIVLAAGRASRFSGGAEGRTKLVAEFEGKPLVRHAVEAAQEAGLAPVVVVTGHARDEVMGALAGLGALEMRNSDYASGIASSLRTGVAAVPADLRAAMVFLGDMPRASADLARLLLSAYAAAPALDAVVPLIEGRRGNPVLIARSLFAEVAALQGDEGARKLLMRPDLRVAEVVVNDSGAALDIDTPEALAKLAVSP